LGLDILKELGGQKAGKKYYMKHAQETMVKEVNQGRQRLITGVLRARDNPWWG
jgi:hypothetical protein